MTAYAFSTIKELTSDGIKTYRPGDKLDDLDKDRVAHLLAVGAASTYDRTKSTGEQVEDAVKEQESLRAKVAELEAKLAEASKNQPARVATASSSSSASK